MSDIESDGEDWFNKDEEEILQNLQCKVKNEHTGGTEAHTEDIEANTEYIRGPSETNEYLYQKRLEASSHLSKEADVKKMTTAEMRKAIHLEPLDVFLFIITNERDFFVDQISTSDGLERVILYLRIWCKICELELPGFQKELLQYFVNNEIFLEQLRVLSAKLFQKKFKMIWKNVEEVEEIIYAIRFLIVRLHKWQLITTKTSYVIEHIKKLIEDSDNPDMVQRQLSQQLKFDLDRVSKEKCKQLNENANIYPTLNELFEGNGEDCNQIINALKITKKLEVSEYIAKQKRILREDFMIPLRDYACKLKEFGIPPHGPEIYEDVCIVLNADFINAKRHEMLFVDVFGRKRQLKEKRKKGENVISLTHQEKKLAREKLSAIKTGSLLLLTTNRSFENLILATVTYTDRELINLGYLGIEIVRQYNIGTFYDRPLLMFETPAFFEPYNNVYNYLNTYGEDKLSMKQYIIDGESNVSPPRYLQRTKPYSYDREKLLLNTTKPTKPKSLPLNESQWTAYCKALTHEFCLIQGPPGTGKTHLSVHLVRTLISNAKTPIVLITYTNDSLDKFLLKLSSYTSNILRFGSQTRLPEISKFNVQLQPTQNEMVNPRLKRLYYVVNEEFKTKFAIVQQMHTNFDGSEESYQSLLAAQRAVRDVQEKLKTIRIMFQFYVARKADIIAMTSTFAARNNFLFRLLQCKIVIFEEAAEILESHVLACLTEYTEHVIMIGDHLQLKPYTSNYRNSLTSQLNISLFERLFVNNLKGYTLNVQYRMRPCIADLIHPTFYTDLKNDETVNSYPIVRNMNKNLYFYTHREHEVFSEDECSIFNLYEVKEILKLAKFLIEKASYTANDIVILSPYAKQVESLKSEALKSFESIKLNISTVDSFQGLEADIVLLSLVRSNDKEQIGFLKEKNRICVALSRAKHGLYIIGNLPLLARCSESWRSIEQILKSQDAIGNEFPLSNEK
ncbi:NFX1-type zinc finger-containing protein 1 [Bactrocera neohumeralis]|uniref:NFX1-type zinc finger-containing protein 1 n=1 Tax=Bactrocera neohumeralis TaxID=98809 RepID=UPI002165D258|nr:NFX1-type zinc finger-containing protein 1 [Bactrocera neohumeralis]